MYCPSCGAAVEEEMTYCNRCGTRLRKSVVIGLQLPKRRSSENAPIGTPGDLRPESLIWAIVAVFTFGLGGTIGLMGMMRAVLGFDRGLILSITFLSLLLMLGVESVFVWLLVSRRYTGTRPVNTAPLVDGRIDEPPASRRQSLPEASASVTEHTTRSFDQIYADRESEMNRP